MRKLLLASASLMFTMGIALAQSTGGQAPGATAPAGTQGMNNTGVTGQMNGTGAGQMTPHKENPGMKTPNAAPGAIGVNGSAPAPGTSSMSNGTTENPGMQSPGASNTSSNMHRTGMHHTAMHEKTMHHGMMGHGTISHHMGNGLPATASPSAYLHMAQMAITHHQKGKAEDAIGRAETDLLNRAVPAGQGAQPDQSGQIQTLSRARKAVMAGQYSEASRMIHQAMSHMSGGGMSNGTSGNSGMSNKSGMSGNSGMSKGGMSSGSGMTGSNGSMGNNSGSSAGTSGAMGTSHNNSSMNNNTSNAMGNNAMGAPAPASRGGAANTPAGSTPAPQ